MKISSWGESAPLSTGARSGAECATVRGRDCKLSDRDINLVIDSSRERYCRDLTPCVEVSLVGTTRIFNFFWLPASSLVVRLLHRGASRPGNFCPANFCQRGLRAVQLPLYAM